MVDHRILLNKIHHYGLRGKVHQWIESYLRDRKQYVSVNGFDSSLSDIEYGVPQGSILGPLLFLIYINDIPEISHFAKFILYADDANIIITGDNIAEIESKIMSLTSALLYWVNSNGLLLNLKKTVFMIFSRRRIRDNFTVHINDTPIERVYEARFLGVIIDDKLTWSSHIKTLKSKMARYVGIMYRIKKLIPLKVRQQIYHSFVQSHLNYCSLVWGYTNKSNIEALFAQQKKGMRGIMPGFVNYFYKDGVNPTSTKKSFNDFSILTIHGIIAQNTIIFMNKIHNFPNTLPISVRSTISESAPSREFRATQETCDTWYDEFNTPNYRKSVFFKGPLMFIDSLVDNTITPKSVQSVKAYKAECKRVMLNLQKEGSDNDWSQNIFLLYTVSGLRKSNRNNLA